MSKKIFNPADWTTQNTKTSKPRTSEKSSFPPLRGGQEGLSDIDLITQRIEAASVDIAPNYADWRDLGFALADALGESGRSYYHRLSCFYPQYNQTETDKQYNSCLKAHGHGVTIKTMYHLAKTAGVDISKYPNCQNGNLETLEISAKNKRTQENFKSLSNIPKNST